VLVCPACGEENPARFRLCGFCGTPLEQAPAPQETRKLVTILFCDLKGSTSLGEALDSESLREVMTHYFEAMSEAITQHGGRVEKFIGDAVMAVFGLPRVHEDDALRAVRAARAMQHALVEINSELETRYGVRLTNRIGVNTGEVVAGDPTQGQRLVIGDPVNVAARLEQAAGDSEVLLGELTYRLTRDFVEVDDVEPLELKGKSERVAAYRLRDLRRARDVPEGAHRELVGREAELSALREAFEACSERRSSSLVTLLAEAGAGKSRLIGEFIGGLREGAVVGRGRCLPYGRGITFWPLIEIVRELAEIQDDDAPEAAHAKLSAIAGDRAEDVVERIGSVMGLLDRQFPIEEVFWATRRLLEIVAATRPLVVCFEDIHWAELTLLDLIEHLRLSEADVPMMIVCGGRPTLIEIRPNWPPVSDDLVIRLGPLSDEQSARLVESLLGEADLPDELSDRIICAAGGNPLYVEQILSMLIEDGVIRRDGDRWGTAVDHADLRIPPTIQALLAARLDLLSDGERGVIEPAAVIGHIFVRPAVEALVPDQLAPEVHAQLASLSEKQLVHPDAEVGEAGYRFHHILIRDAAYQSLLKRTRAVLHERFVEWRSA
jgi:class 3 adenylate cyclase